MGPDDGSLTWAMKILIRGLDLKIEGMRDHVDHPEYPAWWAMNEDGLIAIRATCKERDERDRQEERGTLDGDLPVQKQECRVCGGPVTEGGDAAPR